MITVTSRQGLFDVALQYCGAMEAAYDIATLNGISLTDDLTNGQQLDITASVDNDNRQYYEVNDIKPATSITTAEIYEILGEGEGIEFWRIEYDFEVQ